jgi:hemolysin activation/secretion protein
MEAGKKNIGASDITLVTNSKIATGYVSYDNYGTRYIGPQQMTGSFALNSFIGSGDTGRVTLTKTPKGGELTYLDGNYTTPITDEGSTGQVGYSRTHTHPLFVLQTSQIDGLSDNYYSMFQFPMIRTRSQNFTLRSGFSYLDTHTTISDLNLYTDHLRNFDIGGTFNFADTWYGANMLSGDFRQGLPILGYTSDQNPDTAETSRPGGRGDYTKFTIQASRLQALKGPWSLYGVINGQWAFNPLLSSEQFTVGGSQIGRGYDVAELIGDKGLSESIELRYDWVFGTVLQTLQLYAFYDAGQIWNLKTSSGSPDRLTILSAGVGSRFYFTKYLSGNFMWAQPLTKQVAAEELIHDGRRPRVFFSVVASFG